VLVGVSSVGYCELMFQLIISVLAIALGEEGGAVWRWFHALNGECCVYSSFWNSICINLSLRRYFRNSISLDEYEMQYS
jgi:hypothetical protein